MIEFKPSDSLLEGAFEPPDQIGPDCTPQELASQILALPGPVVFHPGMSPDFTFALEKLKRAVEWPAWRRILRKLVPVLNTGVLEGDFWIPRVLANGGVAIRNYHRVMQLDLWIGVSVSGAPPAQIRREVETVLSRGAASECDVTMLLHHAPEGIFYWNEGLDKLDFVQQPLHYHGQSLLFTRRSLVRDLPILGLAARTLRAGDGWVLVFRLFHDTVCGYSCSRQSDHADTLLSLFSATYPDEGMLHSADRLLTGNDESEDAWESWMVDAIDMELPSWDIPELLLDDFRWLMMQPDPCVSWSEMCAELLTWFPALFTCNPFLLPWQESDVRESEKRPVCKVTIDEAISAADVKAVLHQLSLKCSRFRRNSWGTTFHVPYTNLKRVQEMSEELFRRFGKLSVCVPHLDMRHDLPLSREREDRDGRIQANSSWFGFRRRNGVRAAEEALPELAARR